MTSLPHGTVRNKDQHNPTPLVLLRINNLLQLPNTRTKKYGKESISLGGSIIWNQLPNQYKAAKTDNEFKMKIKSWKGFECTCRIFI